MFVAARMEETFMDSSSLVPACILVQVHINNGCVIQGKVNGHYEDRLCFFAVPIVVLLT
jgi:hypothetical protein